MELKKTVRKCHGILLKSRALLLSVSETKTNEVLLACFHGSVEQKVVKKQIVTHNFEGLQCH